MAGQTDTLLEECSADFERTQTELKEIDLLIQQTVAEVNRMAQRNAQAANRLRQVETQFDSIPRPDIREAYTTVLETQQRLFTMRGQLEKLQSDQRHLDQYVGLLRKVLDLGHDEALSLDEEGDAAGSESVPTVVRVIEAQERERQHMARQMHDGPAQALTNLRLLQAAVDMPRIMILYDPEQRWDEEQARRVETQLIKHFTEKKYNVFETKRARRYPPWPSGPYSSPNTRSGRRCPATS